MHLRYGIVGLPNVGKSTLFNALMASQNAEAANYPFCTIEPNVGTVIVPDPRLDFLGSLYKSPKVIPCTIEFVDIAGLVQGASKGEGLGNQFLAHIRDVDAIIHLVRCFEDKNVSHISDEINPKKDIEIVETELILKDIETVDKLLAKISKAMRTGDKKLKSEYELLEALKLHLGSSRIAKYFEINLNDAQKFLLKNYFLLTDKPVLYVANVDDNHIHGNDYSEIVKSYAEKEGAKSLILSAEVESEISLLESAEEKLEFLNVLDLKESGLNRLVREGYKLLDLITFFTHNDKEVRSWTVKHGTKAPQAAGVIHTDFEKGFIRAEVINYKDLFEFKSDHKVREHGLLHVHGKDYIVEDADIIYFRFNI